jgi:DNA-binding LytR/AlgR family response regulator
VNTAAVQSAEPVEEGGLLLRLGHGLSEMASRRRARHLRRLLGM